MDTGKPVNTKKDTNVQAATQITTDQVTTDIDQTEIETQVQARILSLLEDISVELWDVEWKNSRLRVLVDTTQGIDTETLGLVSRILSSELDKLNPVSQSYTLEVSSPGLERTLRLMEHYQSSIGMEVSLKLNSPFQNQWNFSGTLLSVADDGVEIESNQNPDEPESYRFLFSDIKKARRVYRWDGEMKTKTEVTDG